MEGRGPRWRGGARGGGAGPPAAPETVHPPLKVPLWSPRLKRAPGPDASAQSLGPVPTRRDSADAWVPREARREGLPIGARKPVLGYRTCHSGPLLHCRGQRRGERTTALGRAEALGAVSVDAGSAAPTETAAPRREAGLPGGRGAGRPGRRPLLQWERLAGTQHQKRGVPTGPEDRAASSCPCRTPGRGLPGLFGDPTRRSPCCPVSCHPRSPGCPWCSISWPLQCRARKSSG